MPNAEVSLWGEVAYLRFTVTSLDERPRMDRIIEEDSAFIDVAEALGKPPLDFRLARHGIRERIPYPEGRISGEDLKRGIQEATQRHLGEQFRSSIGEVTKGSIADITVIISAIPFAGAVYVLVNYDKMRNNLLLLLRDIQQLIDTFLGEVVSFPTQISGNVTPGPALYTAQSLAAVKASLNQSRNFLVYIALIHSVLLVAIVIILL